MQNETIKLLMERKSVRAFTDQDITPEEKTAILAAAMRAPTAGNAMMYTIIDVTDPNLKTQLATTCDNQPFIAKAPLVLVFCADYHRWMRKYKQAGITNIPKPELSDLILAANDAIIAAHAACVAAQSLGIGSCYIGDIVENWEQHQALMQLPIHVAPVSMLVFGYPTQQQLDRPQVSRFPQEMIVFENTYKELTADALHAYFSDERAIAYYKRKYVSDFSREMVRSFAEIYKNWNQE